MRIIDLLNKIANKEELPQQIKIYDEKLRLNENKDNYLYEESDEYYGDELIHWFNLNTEVEIIEDKEIIKDKEIERLNNIINKGKIYCEDVIQEYENGEYNVSTTQLAIEEHKKNIISLLNILNGDLENYWRSNKE